MAIPLYASSLHLIGHYKKQQGGLRNNKAIIRNNKVVYLLHDIISYRFLWELVSLWHVNTLGKMRSV